jgi:hypothetical protein
MVRYSRLLAPDRARRRKIGAFHLVMHPAARSSGSMSCNPDGATVFTGS